MHLGKRFLLIQVNSSRIFSGNVTRAQNKPSVADDETAEHCPNTSTGSGYSHCGSSSSDELGSGVNVPADSAGLEAPQYDLGEGALWHQSDIALEQEKT